MCFESETPGKILRHLLIINTLSRVRDLKCYCEHLINININSHKKGKHVSYMIMSFWKQMKKENFVQNNIRSFLIGRNIFSPLQRMKSRKRDTIQSYLRPRSLWMWTPYKEEKTTLGFCAANLSKKCCPISYSKLLSKSGQLFGHTVLVPVVCMKLNES